MAKHTPGPWEWDEDDGYIMLSPGVMIFDGFRDGTPFGDEIDRANARLIAAAPEMFEALKAHVEYETTPTDRGGKNGPKGKAWQRFVQLRDAAIAKAEGR